MGPVTETEGAVELPDILPTIDVDPGFSDIPPPTDVATEPKVPTDIPPPTEVDPKVPADITPPTDVAPEMLPGTVPPVPTMSISMRSTRVPDDAPI